MVAALLFVACDDDGASAKKSDDGEEVAHVVDTLYVFSKDTVYSVERDTVYSVARDTVYSVVRDSVYFDAKDTIYSVIRDTIYTKWLGGDWAVYKETDSTIQFQDAQGQQLLTMCKYYCDDQCYNPDDTYCLEGVKYEKALYTTCGDNAVLISENYERGWNDPKYGCYKDYRFYDRREEYECGEWLYPYSYIAEALKKLDVFSGDWIDDYSFVQRYVTCINGTMYFCEELEILENCVDMKIANNQRS